MNLSVIFHLKGVNFTISGACASGSHAIGMGFSLIRHGYQKHYLRRSTGNKPFLCWQLRCLGAFSKQESEPKEHQDLSTKDETDWSRVAVLLPLYWKSSNHALKRGAPILAEIVGYGFSSDGSSISVPDVDGPIRAISMALKDAL